MEQVIQRMREPSSLAGLGMIGDAVVRLFANPRDVVAWGVLFGGLGAVLAREGAR